MFSTFTPIDVFIFLGGFAFVLKKVADMDRYQTLRRVVLTSLLGAIVIYSLLGLASDGRPFESDDCAPHFTLSEM